MKLDLGCGKDKHEECVGIDWSRENSDADIIHDLNDMPWPIEDDSTDEVYASHILEHLDDLTGALKEICRVCRNGAVVRIWVPYCGCESAFYPEHKWYFGTQTLSYYCFGNYAGQGKYPRLFNLKRRGWNIIGTNLKHELLESVVKALGGTHGVLRHLITELYFELEVVK